MDNSVFISYRRDASAYLARAIYQDLHTHGIDVFMDVESINAGQFNKIIMNQIAARPYFLLLLTPGTLERCKEPKDWLLLEIEQAMTLKRQIVLLHTPKFDFGDFDKYFEAQPSEELKLYNAIDVPHNYFEAAMDRLRNRFLTPIDLPSTPAPEADAPAVQKNLDRITAEPKVTQMELTAQEYFERAFARSGDDLDGQIADYSEALRLNPQYAVAYNNRGVAFYKRGDLDRAIADYNEALHLDPQDAGTYYNRGSVFFDKGDPDQAIADYNEALHLDPQDASTYYNRGLAFFDRGDLDQAIADYDETLRLNPQHANTYNNRGWAKFLRHDFDGAIADCTESIRLDPGNWQMYHSRAAAYAAKGDVALACTDFQEALTLVSAEDKSDKAVQEARDYMAAHCK